MTPPPSSMQSPAHSSHPSATARPAGFPPHASHAAAASFTPAFAHASSPGHASTSAQQAAAAAAAAATPLDATCSATGTTPSGNAPKVLPYLFDDAHIDDVLVLVVDMLVKLTEHNDSLPLHPSALTRFHSRATPNISLSAYLRRIAKYTSIEKCCVLILLVYIDRVCERLEGFTICGLTVHRFICAAILCASKALCDAFNTNEHYAKVGGISLQEINLLEKEFLQIIDWRLICSGGVLQHYYASLVRSHREYVLAPAPAEGKGKTSVELGGVGNGEVLPMVEDAVSATTGSISGYGNGSGSSSSSSSASGSSASSLSRPRDSANATPALPTGSSQHSSPFPISSTSASPFTPAPTTMGTNGSVVGMQVDPPAEPAAPLNSRRRKDEQRTPPSGGSAGNGQAIVGQQGPSHHSGHAHGGGAGEEGFKRGRYGPSAQQSPSSGP